MQTLLCTQHAFHLDWFRDPSGPNLDEDRRIPDIHTCSRQGVLGTRVPENISLIHHLSYSRKILSWILSRTFLGPFSEPFSNLSRTFLGNFLGTSSEHFHMWKCLYMWACRDVHMWTCEHVHMWICPKEVPRKVPRKVRERFEKGSRKVLKKVRERINERFFFIEYCMKIRVWARSWPKTQ